jgi:hypothetical protein
VRATGIVTWVNATHAHAFIAAARTDTPVGGDLGGAVATTP